MAPAHAPASPFGVLLKRYRRAAGLTQEALAEQARLSVRGIQDLERGVSQAPRTDTVALLAAALGLSAEERTDLVAAARRPPRPPAQPAPIAPGALVPLVGRQRELALLAQFLAGGDALGPAAPLLMLAGEPGIGKTRLLQAAAQQAIAQGWSVLVGGCHRRGGQEPYAPLLDALAQHLHAQPPARLRPALSGCAWLVRLLPELAEVLEPLPAGALPPQQERRLLFAAVSRVLANGAGPAGTLLVLDDLQWAGPDALDLLAVLMRASARAHPVRHGFPLAGGAGAGVLRVVGAYRDTEVRPADPLGLLLADLAQAALVRHHALGPLAAEDAATLLDDLLAGRGDGDRAVVERALQRAGGAPFFLVSYAQALRMGSAEAVPWDVAQGVRQRLALLPEAARQALGAAAIVGRSAPRVLLMAAAGQAEEGVLVGLEAACRARLLQEEGDDAYAFTHDVIREVVEADVGGARRALLHRRVAAALERAPAGASPERLAYHYARGGALDKAMPYLEQAGDQAWAQRAHGAAERHYRELLDRLEALGRMQDALRVREKLGEVLYQTGRYEAAIAVLQPAAQAFRASGDLESLGRIAAQIGWMHSLRGTPHEGLTLIQPLVERVERNGASLALPALYAAWGQLLFAAGQYEASLAANERALALVGAGGDARTRVRAAYNRMVIFQMLGRLSDALRANQEVLPLAESVGHLNTLLGVLRDVSYMHALRGAIATSRAHLERAGVAAGQMADLGPAAYTRAQRAWVAFLGGVWSGARSALDEAVALSRQVDRSWYAPYPLIFRARPSLAEGNGAAAAAALQEALALAAETADLQAQHWASTAMAELDVLEGRPEAAGARLVPLLDRAGLEELDVTTLLPVLAWAYLEQGAVDQAAAVVGQALARARREDMRLVLVEALRVQALVALRQGCCQEAACSLEEGVTLARSMPCPYAEARLLHVCGYLQMQKGEREAAWERLEAALAIFARLGARTDAEQVEQALSTLRHAPPPDASAAAPAGAHQHHGGKQASGRLCSHTARVSTAATAACTRPLSMRGE